jgi:hypothetical protein
LSSSLLMIFLKLEALAFASGEDFWLGLICYFDFRSYSTLSLRYSRNLRASYANSWLSFKDFWAGIYSWRDRIYFDESKFGFLPGLANWLFLGLILNFSWVVMGWSKRSGWVWFYYWKC